MISIAVFLILCGIFQHLDGGVRKIASPVMPTLLLVVPTLLLIMLTFLLVMPSECEASHKKAPLFVV